MCKCEVGEICKYGACPYGGPFILAPDSGVDVSVYILMNYGVDFKTWDEMYDALSAVPFDRSEMV